MKIPPKPGQIVWTATFTLKNPGEPAVHPQVMIAEMKFVSEGEVIAGAPHWILKPAGESKIKGKVKNIEHPASAAYPTREHAVYIVRKHIIDIVEKLAALLDAPMLAIKLSEKSLIVSPDGNDASARGKIITLPR